MEMTVRELVTLVHGMMFGGFFLLTGFGALVGMVRSRYAVAGMTDAGYRWDAVYWGVTVALGWAAVLSGAYVVYPWYRAVVPAGAGLAGYPQRLLLSRAETAGWHSVGMEWKEHVAWMAPMAMTAVASVVVRYREGWSRERVLRRVVLAFGATAILAGLVAGGWGALIDKAAPITGGRTMMWMGVGR